jgi:hypothetical protein
VHSDNILTAYDATTNHRLIEKPGRVPAANAAEDAYLPPRAHAPDALLALLEGRRAFVAVIAPTREGRHFTWKMRGVAAMSTQRWCL